MTGYRRTLVQKVRLPAFVRGKSAENIQSLYRYAIPVMSGSHSPFTMLQNTTFGGIQGFTRQPSTPWWDDNGDWAGIIHQERNWTYALFYGTGHEVPAGRPVAVCEPQPVRPG